MAPGLRSAPACCAGACRGPSSWFGPTAAPVRECDVRFAGHGGFPQGRLNQHVDGEPGLNYLCPSYGEFFDHVDKPMRATAGRLAGQRAPAEISPVPTAAA